MSDKTTNQSNEPNSELPWTGERLIPGVTGRVFYEHIHRYAIACELVDGGRVLDIACGEGYGANLLARCGGHVIGIDIAEEAIQHARRRYPRPNLEFLTGDCGDLPLPDRSVDCIVSFETIEHILCQEKFLAEVLRVLSPNGWLLISSPDRIRYSTHRNEANPFHAKELTHDEFVSLLGAHFKHTCFALQETVSGSAVLPAAPSWKKRGAYKAGAFSGDMNETSFVEDFAQGTYSLALCSNGRLPVMPIGVFDVPEQSNRHWDIVENHAAMVAGIEARLKDRELELDKRAAWAMALSEDLKTARTETEAAKRDLETVQRAHDELQKEIGAIQEAEKDLRRQHDSLISRHLSLQRDFEERTAWALDLQREMEELRFHFHAVRRAYEAEVDARRSIQRSAAYSCLKPLLFLTRVLAPFIEPVARTLFRNPDVEIAPGLDALFSSAGGVVSIEGIFRKPGVSEAPLLEVRVGLAEWPLKVVRKDDGQDEFTFFGDVRLGKGVKLVRLVECFPGRKWSRLLAVRWVRAGKGRLCSTSSSAPKSSVPRKGNGACDVSAIRLPAVERPIVSIVIPIFNQLEYTLRCLESLSRHTCGKEAEVIVGNDCSDDAVIATLKKIENLRLEDNPGPRGFVSNCNYAARAARGRFLFFLNSDTEVDADWLDPLMRVFEEYPDAGVVGSKLVYPDGSLQEAGGIIWKDASGWNYGRNDDPEKPEYNYVRETDYVSGAALMIEKSLFENVGGFSEHFAPAYFEDTDLAFKVRQAGRKVFYQPDSRIVHHEGKSCGTDTAGSGLKKYQLINAEKFHARWKAVLAKEHLPNAENIFHARDRSRSRPTIVVIDHYVPHVDQDAGSRSTFQYLKLFLEMGMNVKFIGDNFFPHQPYTKILQQLGVEVLYGDWYHDHIHQWLEEHGERIDYVFSNRSHITIKYLGTIQKMRGTRFLYYGHDLGSLRNRRKYELSGDLANLEACRREEAFEHAIWKVADAIYYPSFVETEAVKERMPEASAFTLPLNIYTPQAIDYSENMTSRRDIMLVGGFNHPPNEDAVLWFLENCWSEIERQLPEVRFYCVGSKPTAKLKERADSRVNVTGWISDEELVALYRRIRLVVIPLRYGAGIKGKVVEALYHHVPMVISPIAAEGLPEIEDYCRIAPDALAFIAEVVRLYQDTEALSSLGNRGSDYLRKYFSKEAALRAIHAGLNPARLCDSH